MERELHEIYAKDLENRPTLCQPQVEITNRIRSVSTYNSQPSVTVSYTAHDLEARHPSNPRPTANALDRATTPSPAASRPTPSLSRYPDSDSPPSVHHDLHRTASRDYADSERRASALEACLFDLPSPSVVEYAGAECRGEDGRLQWCARSA